MPQFVQVKNNTTNPPSISKMDSNIAKAWVDRHDADPKTKGQYEILAPVKINVTPAAQETEKKSQDVVVEIPIVDETPIEIKVKATKETKSKNK